MISNMKPRSNLPNSMGRVRSSDSQRARTNTTKSPETRGASRPAPRTLSPRSTHWGEAVKATKRAFLFIQDAAAFHVNRAIRRSNIVSVRRPTPSPHDAAVVLL